MSNIPNRRTPDPELRLLALYTLDRLGPCTDLTLLQFLFDYDLMNYFELMLSLADLCKQGHAVRSEMEAAWCYEITQAGKELLRMFESRIPSSKREVVDENAAAWVETIKLERERTAVVRQTERGEYEVTMTLNENEMELMRVSLSLPTQELAGTMAQGWKTQAGGVYQTIIGLLREKHE